MEQPGSSWQQLISALDGAVSSLTDTVTEATKLKASAAAELVAEVRSLHEQVDEQVKRLSMLKQQLRTNVIPEIFEQEDIRSLITKSGFQVILTTDVHCTVKGGKKEDVFDWLRTEGQEGLITETVNASTLKAWYKGILAEGKDVPEDLFNTHVGQSCSVRKARKS